MGWPMFFAVIGGFFGAMARYACGRLAAKRFPDAVFPVGTLAVNLSGSFMIGFLNGFGVPEALQPFLFAGFLGAFTTFSTFKMELVRLLRQSVPFAALLYLLVSYSLGLFLALAGYGFAGWFLKHG